MLDCLQSGTAGCGRCSIPAGCNRYTPPCRPEKADMHSTCRWLLQLKAIQLLHLLGIFLHTSSIRLYLQWAATVWPLGIGKLQLSNSHCWACCCTRSSCLYYQKTCCPTTAAVVGAGIAVVAAVAAVTFGCLYQHGCPRRVMDPSMMSSATRKNACNCSRTTKGHEQQLTTSTD